MNTFSNLSFKLRVRSTREKLADFFSVAIFGSHQ